MTGGLIEVRWRYLACVLLLLAGGSTVSYSQDQVIVDGITPKCVVNQPGQAQHPGPDVAQLFPSPVSGRCSGSIQHNCATARKLGSPTGSAYELIPTACVGTFTPWAADLLANIVKQFPQQLLTVHLATGAQQHVVKNGYAPGPGIHSCAMSGADVAECDVTVWSAKDTEALIAIAQQNTEEKLDQLNTSLKQQIVVLQANVKALADANDALTKRLNDLGGNPKKEEQASVPQVLSPATAESKRPSVGKNNEDSKREADTLRY